MSTLRWVPICQGFANFSGFLYHFVLAKLATSSIRVKGTTCLFCNFATKPYFTMYDVTYVPLLCVARLSPSLAFSICPSVWENKPSIIYTLFYSYRYACILLHAKVVLSIHKAVHAMGVQDNTGRIWKWRPEQHRRSCRLMATRQEDLFLQRQPGVWIHTGPTGGAILSSPRW